MLAQKHILGSLFSFISILRRGHFYKFDKIRIPLIAMPLFILNIANHFDHRLENDHTFIFDESLFLYLLNFFFRAASLPLYSPLASKCLTCASRFLR